MGPGLDPNVVALMSQMQLITDALRDSIASNKQSVGNRRSTMRYDEPIAGKKTEPDVMAELLERIANNIDEQRSDAADLADIATKDADNTGKLLDILRTGEGADKDYYTESMKQMKAKYNHDLLEAKLAREYRQDQNKKFEEQRKDEKNFYAMGFKKDRTKKSFLEKVFSAKREGKSLGSAVWSAGKATLYEKTIKDSVDSVHKIYDVIRAKKDEGNTSTEIGKSEGVRDLEESRMGEVNREKEFNRNKALFDRTSENEEKLNRLRIDNERTRSDNEIANFELLRKKINELITGPIPASPLADTELLPHAAIGAVVTKEQDITVGEKGKPEAILPLDSIKPLLSSVLSSLLKSKGPDNKQKESPLDLIKSFSSLFKSGAKDDKVEGKGGSFLFKSFSSLLKSGPKDDKASSSDDEVKLESDETYQETSIKHLERTDDNLERIYKLLKAVSDPASHAAFTIHRLKKEDVTGEGGSKTKEIVSKEKSSLFDKFANIGKILPIALAGIALAAGLGTLYASTKAVQGKKELQTNQIERAKVRGKAEDTFANEEAQRVGMKKGEVMKGIGGGFDKTIEATKGLNVEQLAVKREAFQTSTKKTEDEIANLERGKKIHEKASIKIFDQNFSNTDAKRLDALKKELMLKKESLDAIDAATVEAKKLEGSEKKVVELKKDEVQRTEVKKEELKKDEAPDINDFNTLQMTPVRQIRDGGSAFRKDSTIPDKIEKEELKKDILPAASLEKVPTDKLAMSVSNDVVSELRGIKELLTSLYGNYANEAKIGRQQMTSTNRSAMSLIPNQTESNADLASSPRISEFTSQYST